MLYAIAFTVADTLLDAFLMTTCCVFLLSKSSYVFDVLLSILCISRYFNASAACLVSCTVYGIQPPAPPLCTRSVGLASMFPDSFFGLTHRHFLSHWVGTTFAVHRLQSAVKLVFYTSSGHFFIMLKVSPVGDGAVFFDERAMAVLNSSSVMSLSLSELWSLGDVWYPILYAV